MPAPKPFRFNYFLLLLILITGGILRFWNYNELPYMHDEFSALNRLDYDNLGELIQEGIKPDGHPAGVQVFLYYWVDLVGKDEIWVKLPFIVCGILSIGLLYLIGSRWFNDTVGLAAAAFLTSLQYSVMYSQIARPYASGLFFSLLMVWGWTLFLFSFRKKKGWSLFVIGAVLCCYNHYFSHLLAIIVGFSGLFFVNRRDVRWYIIAGFVILVLYLPHIPIFLHQISIGGVSWLAPPQPSFFLEYPAYIFHFSIPLFLLVILIIAGSRFLKKEQTKNVVQIRFLSLCWFLLPLLTGYFYSLWSKPILQYSILLFSFPFLLLFLFSFLPKLLPLWNAALVMVILTACILTLVLQRHHYYYFYNHTFKAVVEKTVMVDDSLGKENVGVLLSANPTHVQFYFDKMHRQPNVARYLSSDLRVSLLRKTLDSLQTQYLVLGAMSAIPGEYIPMIRQKYPYMIKRETGSGFEFYLFSKKKTSALDAQPSLWTWESDFESGNGLLTLDSNYLSHRIRYDGSTSFLMDSTIEFGPTARFTKKELPALDGDILIISVKVLAPDTPVNAVLALNISEGEESVYWTDRQLMRYVRKPGQWETVYLAINPAHALWDNGKTMSIFIWNMGHDVFYLDEFRAEVVEENRNRNVLMERVREPRE